MSTWLRFAVPAIVEISLLLLTTLFVYRAQKNRIYPALWQLLIFWAASDVVMLGEGWLAHLHVITGVQAYLAYRCTYWPSFAINAILMLRVLHEMFRHAVRSVPGVQKLGRPIFFWGMVVSVIIAFAAGITPHTAGMGLLLSAAQVLMRSEAVLALCMLTFLAFASRTLGVSYGSRIFGVIFGFGIMATVTLVNSALLGRVEMSSIANIALVYVNFVGIAIWAGYFLKPEPARRLVAMPVTSPLMRWNDIAQTLGNPAGQIAIAYPPSFMKDVHELVNNVMGAAGWPGGGAAASASPPGPIAS